MTPEPQSNDAREAAKAMRRAGLCPTCGHRGFDCTCVTIETGTTAAQTITALRAELEQAKRTLALQDRQLKDKDAAIHHWIDKYNEIQTKLC